MWNPVPESRKRMKEKFSAGNLTEIFTIANTQGPLRNFSAINDTSRPFRFPLRHPLPILKMHAIFEFRLAKLHDVREAFRKFPAVMRVPDKINPVDFGAYEHRLRVRACNNQPRLCKKVNWINGTPDLKSLGFIKRPETLHRSVGKPDPYQHFG